MLIAKSSDLNHPPYRSDIDGLRAIAVLSVVGFHAFPNWVKGGFVGVDVFFVISGFLISSIILRSLNSDSFSFIEFYARRVKRIFPALILVMTACYVFGWFALLPDEYKQLGKHVAAGAGFVSNFFFWQEAGYFDNVAETKPLLHLWSLGIEEQFYIVWPLLLYLARKWRFNFLVLAVTIVAISFAINVSIRHSDPIQTFYSPITRFWELLIGSILAYFTLHGVSVVDKLAQLVRGDSPAPKRIMIMIHNASSLTGLLLIVVATLLVTKEYAFPGFWALLPTMGGCLIISVGQDVWLNKTLLSHPVLVWFGLISYPLYLWHWPLLAYARIMESRTPDISIRFTAIVVAIVLAWLTYRFLEYPLRAGKQDLFKVSALILIMIGLGGVGIITFVQDGIKQRSSVQKVIEQLDELGLAKHWTVWMSCEKKDNSKGCRIMDFDKPPDVALLGDSHAMELVFSLEDLFRPLGKNIIARAKPGCSPFFETGTDKSLFVSCDGFMEKGLALTEESQSIKTIILGGYGMLRIQGSAWLSNTNNFSKEELEKRAMSYKNAMYATFKRLVKSGKKVIFIVDVPELNFNPDECVSIRPLYLLGHKLKSPCAVPLRDFEQRTTTYHRIIAEAKEKFPMIRFIDAYKYFCDDKLCNAIIDGQLMYRDDNHINRKGAHFLAKRMAQELLN